MRSPLLLIVAAVLLGTGAIAVWWLGDPGTPTPMATAAAEASSTGAPAVAADGSLAREAAAAAVADPVDEPTAEEGDEGEGIAREGALPDEHRGPSVRVVRGEPPMPVADAEVFFVGEADVDERLAARKLSLPRHEQPAAVGQRMITDADGIARLPRGRTPLLCAAVAGGEFAFAVIPPRPRQHTLVLQTDETLRLVARHDAETPAPGIPLGVLWRRPDQEARTLWRGESGRDGRVAIRHFQLLREAGVAEEAFGALALVPAAAMTTFAGRPVAGDEVEILVPALGGIAVQVVDHAGNPVLSPAVVGLAGDRPANAANVRPDFVPPRGLTSQRRDKPLGAEAVLLPFSEVGADVRIWARFPNDRRAAEVGPLRGPGRAGETATATVTLHPQQSVLAGQVVGPDGAPVAPGPHELDVALWRHDRDVLATKVYVLADGRFDLVLPQRTDAEQFTLELRHTLPPPPVAEGERKPAPTQLGARVRIGAIRGGQRQELGLLRLETLPPLVTGVVVDDAGQPVANADVQVQQQEPPQRGRDPRDGWRALPLLRTRSSEDGTFVVPGLLPPGVLRVRADTDQHFADSVPLGAQGQRVRIAIVRNGVLRGRVLLPDWVGEGALSLVLRPADETLRERETRTIALSRRGGGRFSVEPLRPGRFDALVMLRNLNEPVATLPDVWVAAGECRDPRFRPLDLRQSLFRYRLRAVDPSGGPLALDGPILARLQGPDGQLVQSAFRWQKGQAELITASGTADLTFFGRGLRTARQVLGPGEHDVMLATLLPVRVEVNGLRGLCGPNRRVRISAILQGDTGLPGDLGGQDQKSGDRFSFNRWDLGRSSGGWLGATDTVEIPLMQSGKYELLLRPHAGDNERTPQGQINLGTFELDVESGHWNPVTVRLDQNAVLQHLQQLDQSFAQAQAARAADASSGRNRR